MTKLHVFCRHAIYSDISKHKKRPSYFSREKCYHNLLQTLPRFATITFLLDTYHGNLQDHFLSQEKKYPVITEKLGSETTSFLFLLDVVQKAKLKDDTIVYLLEDDYLHKASWGKVLLDGFSHPQVDYLSLYDHNDKYDQKLYPHLQSTILQGKYCYFRSTPSTTNTFAVQAKTLLRDMEIQRSFSVGRKITEDHQKFLKLGEEGRRLFSALPGWSTHMEIGLQSPFVDWKKVSEMPRKNLLHLLWQKASGKT